MSTLRPQRPANHPDPLSNYNAGTGLSVSPEALAAAAAQGINVDELMTARSDGLQGAVPATQFSAPVSRPAAPSKDNYSAAGSISADSVISATSAKFAYLDPRIAAVVAQVQESLVESGSAARLVEARFNPVLRSQLMSEIDRLALGFLLQGRTGNNEETQVIVASVVNEIIGLGPLEPLWLDPSITEVIVNGPNEVFVEKAGKLIPAHGVRFRSKEHLLEVCQRILSPLNRKLDVKDPLADGRLPDGSRVNAVHFALAPNGPLLTIRRFPEANRSLVDLVEVGAMSQELATTVAWLVANKASTLVVGGTGSGKLVPLGTPIPTPSGWTTMGSLQVGSRVLGRDGHPCKVTFLSDIDLTPDLYRLDFADGQEIVADADHQWVVGVLEGGSPGHIESVMTTRAILDAGLALPDGRPRFAIRATLPVTLPFVTLDEDPYDLGLRIGGGRDGFLEGIPAAYLRAAAEQRLSVLQGVMDSCGVITSEGVCKFSLEGEQLSRDVLSLVRSLGIIATIMPVISQVEGPAGGKSNGNVFRVTFTTGEPVFRVSWKAARLPAVIPLSASWVDLLSVTTVDSEPGRCIQVDSPDSTYLIHDFVPTHNTTMLNALSAAIPLNERIITIEDSLELRLNPVSHVAAMEARPADASGKNIVTIRELVKNALRMRPDRIIVGEIRDQSALDMLQACNTGHEGSMSTVHANGANEAISRISVMVAQGGEFPADKVDWLVGSALDLILMIRRYKDGSRRVSGLYEVPSTDSMALGEPLRTIPLWEWKRTGESDNGMLIGEYIKMNDISEDMRNKLGLDYEPLFTWADLERIAGKA